jgi:phage terminase large subunit-like protein
MQQNLPPIRQRNQASRAREHLTPDEVERIVAVAQRLTAAGLPMIAFPQSVPNLTESSTNLFEAIKRHNFVAYPDDELRLAVSRCVALETSRGWRIAKEKASHKIDVIVALAMAAFGAVREGQGAGGN